MNKKRSMLENWIYGLFGFEENTFITVRRLVKDLLDNGFTGFKSKYIDYPDGETYELELSIKKITKNTGKVLEKPYNPKITVNVDADEVMEKVDDYVKKNYYGNWTGSPHFKEDTE